MEMNCSEKLMQTIVRYHLKFHKPLHIYANLSLHSSAVSMKSTRTVIIFMYIK